MNDTVTKFANNYLADVPQLFADMKGGWWGVEELFWGVMALVFGICFLFFSVRAKKLTVFTIGLTPAPALMFLLKVFKVWDPLWEKLGALGQTWFFVATSLIVAVTVGLSLTFAFWLVKQEKKFIPVFFVVCMTTLAGFLVNPLMEALKKLGIEATKETATWVNYVPYVFIVVVFLVSVVVALRVNLSRVITYLYALAGAVAICFGSICVEDFIYRYIAHHKRGITEVATLPGWKINIWSAVLAATVVCLPMLLVRVIQLLHADKKRKEDAERLQNDEQSLVHVNV